MLDATYREKIIEEILREKLQDGIVPTADELMEEFESRTVTHSDFSIPIIRDKDHEVALRSRSNSKKFNDFFTRARSDLKVLYTEIWDRVLDGGESFDRWRIEVERLKKELLELEIQIDGLLFLRQDTEGYFAFIEETFTDLEDIDQVNTTANVDIVNHQVTIDNKAATDGRVKIFGLQKNKNEMASIDMNNLQEEDVSFTILTRDDIASSTLAGGSVTKAFIDSSQFWQHQVRTSRGDKPISAELKVKFNGAVQVSGITMSLHSANNSSPVTVVAQYSIDGYNWFNLPTENYTQSIDNYGAFHFKKTYMKWVKFIMTKFGPDAVDNGQYVYEFGANMIRFLRTTFPISTSSTAAGIYQSEYMSSYDDDNNRRTFDKVSLRTCQETPGLLSYSGIQTVPDTSIAYEVKASNGTDETDWLKISPEDIKQADAPTIVKFGKTTGPSRVIPTDLSVEQEKLKEWHQSLTDSDMVITALLNKASAASQTYFQQYSDILSADKLVLLGEWTTWLANPTIPYIISSDDLSNIRSFNFHRNVGVWGGMTNIDETEEIPIRGAQPGWHKQEDVQGYVITTLLLLTDTVIDFGNTTAFLDNKQISGKTTFTKGYHLFRTHERNYKPVPWGDPATLVTWASEEALSDYDSLYPYNHRKLIEGVLYADDFDGQKIYNGVDLHFERFGQRVSIFDLLYNTQDDDYTKYAIDTYNGEHVFVMKYNIEDSTVAGIEAVVLQYNIAQDPYDRVKLKASLYTQSPLRTPVLSAWRVKLG